MREGWAAKDIARAVIEAAGFTDIQKDQRQPGGVEVNFTARDSEGTALVIRRYGELHNSSLRVEAQ